MKKVLVLGASENPSRYSNIAITRLLQKEHEVLAVGRREGRVESVAIHEGQPELNTIDTVTMYLNPTVQEKYKEYILDLKPRRIIFNPGTENDEWYDELKNMGIEVEEACTLVLLSTGQF